MIMVKHDEIEGLLGDLPFATIERGTHEPIDHLDQRGGPHNGVELVKYQHFEGVTGVTQETVGTRQPEVSFWLMVAFFLRPRLVASRRMVPGQHKEISGSLGHHETEFRSNRFGVFEWDSQGIEMLAQGRERFADGGAVERCEHVEQEQQC